MFRLALIIITFLSLTSLTAQRARVAGDWVKSATAHINNDKFEAARKDLNSAISEKEDFAIAHRLLGFVQVKLGNWEKAAKSYERLFQLNPLLSRAAYFEYGLTQLKLNNYDKAYEYFDVYKNTQPHTYKTEESDLDRIYDVQIEREWRNAAFAKEAYQSVSERPENLGAAVNSSADEYMPSLSADGRTLLFTQKSEDENIFMAQLERNGDWGGAFPLKSVNTTVNEGMARFNTCGTELLYAGCQRESSPGGCDLYTIPWDYKQAAMPEDDVHAEVLIKGGNINTKSWDSQPSISCDGNTLYFASSREGGVGGTDIWKSTRSASGVWSEAVNLGPTVNTPYDEEAPYIANDGITLYFASDGHVGFGEADIFKTIFKDSAWTVPFNLGSSVNSAFREAGFCLSYEENEALFASAREGGEGGLDLYRVGLARESSPAVSTVMVRGTVMSWDRKVLDAKVRVKQQGNLIRQITSDKTTGNFFLCLPNDNIYSFIVDKKSYDTYINAMLFKRPSDSPFLDINIVMPEPGGKSKTEFPVDTNKIEKKKRDAFLSVGTTSVFFETGKSTMNKPERDKLQSLFSRFANPETVSVKIVGYADENGGGDLNVNLSKLRADEVRLYFELLGVNPASISVDGKGEDAAAVGAAQKRRVEVYITQE